MKSTRKALLLAAVFLAFIPATVCNAWWSISLYNTEEDPENRSSHLQIGQEAMNSISDQDYPDLKQMRSGIDGGIDDWMSGPNDDKRAHGLKYQADAGDFDGGPIDRWWHNSDYPSDGVLYQYKQFNFVGFGNYSAYYYLAMMAHLVADQAVPAHAANIKHVQPIYQALYDPDYGDNLENGADRTVPQPYTGPLLGIDETARTYNPTFWYFDPVAHQGSLDQTQGKLSTWKKPNTEIQYWNAPSDPAKVYQGQAFNIGTDWGKYGTNADDVEADTYHWDASADTQKILQDQFTQAIQYTAGVLCAASRKLPPLVRDFHVQPNDPVYLDTAKGNDIRFTIMENRLQAVYVTISAIPVNDQQKEYFLKDGEDVWENKKVDLDKWNAWDSLWGQSLPWKRTHAYPVNSIDHNI